MNEAFPVTTYITNGYLYGGAEGIISVKARPVEPVSPRAMADLLLPAFALMFLIGLMIYTWLKGKGK